MNISCPKCGGELQAITVNTRYWSFNTDRAGRVAVTFVGLGDEDSETRFYCENDCEDLELAPEVQRALDEALIEFYRDEDPRGLGVPRH